MFVETYNSTLGKFFGGTGHVITCVQTAPSRRCQVAQPNKPLQPIARNRAPAEWQR